MKAEEAGPSGNAENAGTADLYNRLVSGAAAPPRPGLRVDDTVFSRPFRPPQRLIAPETPRGPAESARAGAPVHRDSGGVREGGAEGPPAGAAPRAGGGEEDPGEPAPRPLATRATRGGCSPPSCPRTVAPDLGRCTALEGRLPSRRRPAQGVRPKTPVAIRILVGSPPPGESCALRSRLVEAWPEVSPASSSRGRPGAVFRSAPAISLAPPRPPRPAHPRATQADRTPPCPAERAPGDWAVPRNDRREHGHRGLDHGLELLRPHPLDAR